MALPIAAAIPVIIYLTIATGAGVALYQLRLTVESVEEIFTDENSALNNTVFQVLLAGVVGYVLTKVIK